MVFVLDDSAAVTASEYHQQLEFIVNVVAQLDVDSGRVRVAVITFGDKAIVRYRLRTHNSILDVVDATKSLPYGGYSADIGSALRTLRTDVFL